MLRLLAFTTIVTLICTTSASAEIDAQLKKDIAQAVKSGQDYLKAARQVQGRQFNPGMLIEGVGGNQVGTPALTGLALIESGLDARDPTVAFIAQQARAGAVSNQSTYEISLLIMFLDRLGQPEDEGLIQFLTLRLMTGQSAEGAWGYSCSGLNLDPVQQRALMAELYRDAKLSTPEAKKAPPKKERKQRTDLDPDPTTPTKKDSPAKEEPKPEPKPKGLHPVVAEIARTIRGGGGNGFGGGDHSNTQFATVGLWCGRRHAVPVNDALAAIDKHYRGTQGADGGWAYTGSGGASSPSMTCAGLMGLAMGFGALQDGSKKADADAIAKDPKVEAALKYVGDFIAAAGAQRDGRGGQVFRANELSANLYFMWSLERVGMVYGLTTIGKVDWYEWGARSLVASQLRDGSWGTDGFHGGSGENSTAFAVLFLTRANLAEDLASSLKGKVKDPGTSKLVGGGEDLAKLLDKAGKGSSGTKKIDPGTGTKQPMPKDLPATTGKQDAAGKLADALLNAAAADRAALLATYRDTKGIDYTDALARAAHKMEGDAQAATRATLAERLTRMTPATLIGLMTEENRELRRGAALAAGTKNKDTVAAALIKATADEESIVAQAARASLKVLTGQDFGPEPGATPAERGKAHMAWQTWWMTQKQ